MDEDGTITVTWDDPGKGYDCETCGWAYESAEVSVAPDGEYTVSMSIGCTGGALFETRDWGQVEDFLADWTHLNKWNKFAKQVRGLRDST